MIAYQRVVDAFEREGLAVTTRGNGKASAQAPGHSPADRSVTITDIGEQVLVHSHSDPTGDVLDALGITQADLFDSPRGLTYTYGDGRKVTRSPDKRFFQAGNTTGRELYRRDQVEMAVLAGQPVFVVEGEKDVHAIEAMGATATCTAMGAGKAKRFDWTPLTGANVIVIEDNDDPGRQHAEQVVEILEPIARTVTLSRAKTGKDAADHIAAGHTLDQLEHVPGNTPHERHQILDWHQVFSSAPDEVDWLVRDVLARGRAYSLVATAKAGKSLLLLDIAASLAAGRSTLGGPPLAPMRVLYVDLENAPQDLADRLRDMNYGPADLGNLRYLSFPSLPALDSPIGGLELYDVAEHHDAQLVVIDTVSRVVSGEENSADTYRALYRHALAPLKAQGRTVVRLDHLGKDATAGARGSSAKNDDVDCVWILLAKSETSITLRRERQRSNHHPEFIELRRLTDPLRHVAHQPMENPVIARLIGQLDELGVPADTGWKAAANHLRSAGIKVRNQDVTAAVRTRKELARGVPDESTQPSLHEAESGGPETDSDSDESPPQGGPGPLGDPWDQQMTVAQPEGVPKKVPPYGGPWDPSTATGCDSNDNEVRTPNRRPGQWLKSGQPTTTPKDVA